MVKSSAMGGKFAIRNRLRRPSVAVEEVLP
jgi:hypothetical protein